ncbi:unnamed protein product [Caretta caretta]
MEKNEIRALIKCLQKKGLTPKAIHEHMLATPRMMTLHRPQEKLGLLNLSEAESQYPGEATTPKKADAVHKMLTDDRRSAVRHIAETVGISTGSVYTVLKDDLALRKVSARWVPRMSSADQKRV